ncbi:MAG: glycosyltransferase family 9 protein [Alphaproteobacteria bacterium]|nr:glycosyltransferase family 9 protein [Alphaproteobacteria bacterium]
MRILFIGPNRIGDAVLASGLLQHLLALHPDARFTIACGAAAAPLFAAFPQLDSLIPMTKEAKGRHWWRLWKRVAAYRWSLVADTRRSVIPWTILARRRVSVPASTHGRVEHAVTTFARAIDRVDDPPAPHVWMSDDDHERARALLPPGPAVLAIGPTANWPGKIWRPEFFLETVRRLTASSGDGSDAAFADARIAVFGARDERALAAPIICGLAPERTIDLVGKVDLPVAAACLKRCDLFIGNDSGLMHMAAAVGTPTLGLFGPSLPERYGPWGEHTSWVRTDKSLEEITGAPGYDWRNTGTLMDTLPVGRVVDAARELHRRMLERAA